MKINPVVDTDAYKITHWLQRPAGINRFYSYGEPRLGGHHDEICFFGFQFILKEYFTRKITQENIEQGASLCKNVFGFENYFPRHIWEKVKELGYFPIRIKAVKEGTILPVSNVCFTIEATEPWFADMVSHFEDYLMWAWYSTAVATRAYNIKKELKPTFSKAADNEFLGYAVNDFGLRGGMFREAAAIGGAAHLIHFEGTDNLPAIQLIEDYYGSVGQYIGGSVWATEHSVATVWGPGEGEYEYVKAQLTRSDPNSVVSIVIDSYDADNFIKKVITREDVKSLILNRPGRVVFRPDSGIPLNNVCKYSEMLGNSFGYSLNRKGYKLLNHNIGLIQGDGMTETSIPETYREYIKTGWSPENFITGSGGGLLVEGLTRDTDRWAIKVSYVERDGESVNVSKAPQSDITKSSKPGMLKLAEVNKRFSTISSAKTDPVMFKSYIDSLEPVFENGVILRDQSFDDVRKTALYYSK